MLITLSRGPPPGNFSGPPPMYGGPPPFHDDRYQRDRLRRYPPRDHPMDRDRGRDREREWDREKENRARGLDMKPLEETKPKG